MNLNIHSPLPERKDWRIGCVGSGFIMSDCHLVAYGKAGFNPAAIASRTVANAATCAAAQVAALATVRLAMAAGLKPALP